MMRHGRTLLGGFGGLLILGMLLTQPAWATLTPRAYLPVIQVGPSPTPPIIPTATPVPAPSAEDQVLTLVNQHRRTAGCAPVYWNVNLSTAAEAHSTDMAVHDFVSHTGSDGSTAWSRAAAAGYPFPVGENIAAGQRTPEMVVAAWMNSPNHRATILNCTYKTTGIGYVHDPTDTFGPYVAYWTQVFGVQ